MPYKKITDLDALTAITDDDLLVVVNSPGSGPGTRKITWAEIVAYFATGTNALTLTNTGLHLLDTNASHDLIVKPGSDLTADRTLTITTGDAARALTFTADVTISAATSITAALTVGGATSITGGLTVEAASVINQDLTTDSTGVRFAGLGINTSPTSPLHVTKTYTGGAAAAEYGANLTITYSGADTGVKSALYAYATATHTSGTLASLYGMYGYAVAAGNGGTTTTLAAMIAQTYIGAGTTIGNAYGVYVATGTQSGTLTTKYGIYVEANTAAFATNKYGLYIGTQSGAATLNWSLYVAGGASYFGDNVGIGQASFGTAATKTLAVGTGTAPSSSPADAFQMYSADQAAGNACPHFRTETGAPVKLYQQAAIADTSGALLADVEAEVNKLKAVLRNAGLIAT